MENNDIGEAYNRLMSLSFPRYRNKIIELNPEGYMVFSTQYPTWEEATKAVDEFYIKFPESVNRIK